ncbi:Glutamate receptor ionotropic, kainate 1 [Homalodisca vitripennis]|nr:Glutamate receptor ionotropic, kainate 1 [Homalodisca vitripennis]
MRQHFMRVAQPTSLLWSLRERKIRTWLATRGSRVSASTCSSGQRLKWDSTMPSDSSQTHMNCVYDPDSKEWNSVVIKLSEKRSDLVVTSMKINYVRGSAIDFTKLFINLGIEILFKVPTSKPTRPFSFMNRLDVDIWMHVLSAYLLASFTVFLKWQDFFPYE